jgi:hypothetical protein
MKSTLNLRAHTETQEQQKRAKRKKRQPPTSVKWAEFALVFDVETTTDDKQSLTFGFYRLLRNVNGSFSEVREEGLFYHDRITAHELRVVSEFIQQNPAESAKECPPKICLRPLREFIAKVFMPTALAGAVVVGFNLPFDIAHIALDARKARPLNEDWSFVMAQDLSPITGRIRSDPFVPRIKVTRKDGKFAFIRFGGVSIRNPETGMRFKPYTPGRFLDLRTLAWALRNVSYSLGSACAQFNVPGKLDHAPSGLITREEIQYCRQDVRATAGLLNALRAEFDCHPIELTPEKAYSPASIAKAYLLGMGLIPPLQKFRLTPKIQGIAAQAYFGGRAEARIRRTAVPTVCTDFKSQYPTVNTLMGLWPLLTAKSVQIQTATRAVRTLLTNVTLDAAFEPSFWKNLVGYALIVPDGDILPVRTCYNGESNNVGVNPLTSSKPIWFAIADLVAATLLSGKPPKILRAFRVVPEGRQRGLKAIALRGRTIVDPRKDDFFKVVIESRERVKADKTLSESERKALGYFLKILANAGSYGLFIETTPKRVPERERVDVRSGETSFSTTSDVVEDKGAWYCPVISSLITAGGRLLLAMLERSVTNAGSTYLFCDTDSMSFVANRNSGLVPCVGGHNLLPDGQQAVKALSWAEAQQIVSRFEELNPYGFPGSILKVEKESLERDLFGYAVSTKRYCLFTRNGDAVQIETASSHGLGYLFMPNSEFNDRAGAPNWIVEAWHHIVSGALGMTKKELPWFKLPAMMRIAITTPNVLKALQSRQDYLRYADRAKPFNFVLSPQIHRLGMSGFPAGADPNHCTLIAPFTKDSSSWFKLRWVNLHDGEEYGLAPITQKTSAQAAPELLEDVLFLYEIHAESKSLAPDGLACDGRTTGLLQRTPVTASGNPQFIGKESDRRWEQEEDISLLYPTLPVYRPNETKKLVTDPEIQNRIVELSVRKMAKKAKVSPATIQAIRDGHRIRKSTARKVHRAIVRMEKHRR